MEQVFWVLGHGLDCDGCNDGHVYMFANKKRAEIFCDDINKGSDGIMYGVTDSMKDLKEYCERFGKNVKNYLSNGGNIVSAVFTTKANLQMENSYSVLRSEDEVELEIIIGIKGDEEDSHGWFELYDTKTGGLDWHAEGMLEIDGNSITGYDGVFALLPAITEKLKELGYDVSEVE